MSLLILLPLFLTLALSLAVTYSVLKRKSLAQAICIQSASRLQENLRSPLEKLLHMNTQATALRTQRTIADDALAAAVSSGVPYAIAAAKAVQLGVILAQTAFRARQWALLTEAERIRSEGQRELRSRASRLPASGIQTPTYFFRALAVEPKPITSLTPNYKPVPLFERAQQTRLRFRVNLLNLFPELGEGLDFIQTTECSVTLQERDERWQIHILAAKAP